VKKPTASCFNVTVPLAVVEPLNFLELSIHDLHKNIMHQGDTWK